MRIEDKLTLLADAAKYDVSCASSGSRRKNPGRRLGNAAPSGICHTYTEDGRCVSLLKILFTNVCIYDCAYCINRRTSDVVRAAFTAREIVSLTIDFYRRNYIEGLFLSSGVVKSPDETMERLVRTVRLLRREGFNGYLHLKCVPFASRRLVRDAGLYADRLSVNIELPSEASLRHLTQEKTYAAVLTPMGVIRETIAETREDRRRLRHVPSYAPAGQSTQLIVGASPESDYEVLRLADRLYREQSLKRVYYSAYIPVGETLHPMPRPVGPPLRREHRLYQADWLVRCYGFSLEEVIGSDAPWLDLEVDPKTAFALRHPEQFPVDVNTADREMLLKVPGIGLKSADRILRWRRRGRLRSEHLGQMGAVVSRARPFIRCAGEPRTAWSGAAAAAPPADRSVPAFPVARQAAPSIGSRLIFETDGTFDGLLCAIFETYARGRTPDAIEPSGRVQTGLFEVRETIDTRAAIAERVWKKLKLYLGPRGRRKLFEAHLSGHPDVETMIYRLVAESIASGRPPRPNASLAVDRLSQKVRREAHRMKGLIRFRQMADHRYVAAIAPRYDVLPLIRHHFETRFADQHWVIVDTGRRQGIGYDGQRAYAIQVDDLATPTGEVDETADERTCQTWWQRYYDAATIGQRANPRLHRRQLPRRYWRYLPEKAPRRNRS